MEAYTKAQIGMKNCKYGSNFPMSKFGYMQLQGCPFLFDDKVRIMNM